MKYRRIWNGYRCQRYRGKSHYQIAMEILAKVTEPSILSSALMRHSLQRHGLRCDVRESEKFTKSANGHDGIDPFFTGCFFIKSCDEELWDIYKATFPKKLQNVIEDADRICRHEFELLGSGRSLLGNPIDWHVDPVSGFRWPKKLFVELKRESGIPKGADIKFPWELSRMQHLPTLAKAYRLTKDERYAREIIEQVNHWWDDNPCPYGVNWICAMDVAIRIMNLMWGYELIRDSNTVTKEFESRLAASAVEHGRYIQFSLECGLSPEGSIANGNHYLSDIVGLLHLGLLCAGIGQAAQWKSFGVKALVEEMDRQVCPDGVDFESSVAYHRLVLELFTAGALLCRANGVSLPKRFWKRLELMYEFVLYVTRPDGQVPVIGDADDGRLYVLADYGNWTRTDFRYLLSIGAALFRRSDMKRQAGPFAEEAFWLLGPTGMDDFATLEETPSDLQSKAFPESGIYVMRSADQYLVASCGRVGTRGLGNHKHNDILSFELYAGGKPFIVDPGSYVYTRDPEWRNTFRSTAYHNTVVIDGHEQNRFDPAQLFKMSPDAEVIVHEWLSTPDLDRLDAEHTGYMVLDRPVGHRRTFQFNKKAQTWDVSDYLTGVGGHKADWYFHLYPGIEIEPGWEYTFRTCSEGLNLEFILCSDVSLSSKVEHGWCSTRYGYKLPNKILHLSAAFDFSCRVVITVRTV